MSEQAYQKKPIGNMVSPKTEKRETRMLASYVKSSFEPHSLERLSLLFLEELVNIRTAVEWEHFPFPKKPRQLQLTFPS